MLNGFFFTFSILITFVFSFSPSYMGQIEELEKVQRRATKLLRECKGHAAICWASKIYGFGNS